MRKDAFRAWLSRRQFHGRKLTANGINNRVGKLPRIERALKALGFEEADLDTLHANGRWPDLVAAVRQVAADWHSNEAAARLMAPQAPDPTRQLNNLPNVARQYGHFADGKDPNYDVDGDDPDATEIDEEALALLKARFLGKYPDFESGDGFPGASSYHPVEDAYKRPLIAKVQALLAGSTPDETALGDTLLGLVLDDKDMNLVGDYRGKDHLRAVRARSGGKFEAAVGALALATDDPPEAAAQFVEQAWELVLEGSEHSKPFADIRVLATLFQALARPERAIALSYTRFHNLGVALLGRSPFGNNVLTADEYRAILDLSAELFAIMMEWGWHPRDLWDVQGFIWVTCEEKLEAHRERDADRIRRYVLETYIQPARQRQAATVDVLVRDVNEALGLNQAWPNICQALAGRKFLEMAEIGPPERIGKDQSSATVFRFGLSKASGRPFILFDAAGAVFQPVRHGERDGRSVFKIKPPGASNKAEEAIAVDTIAEVAVAMLIDRLPARIQSVSGGPVNYIGYGKQKLVRYELDPVIAHEIGVPPKGSVDTIDADATSASRMKGSVMPTPTNLILYGPPGTGKTWRTAAEAVRLCDGLGDDDPFLRDPVRRAALMERYEALVSEERIGFVTFHQNFSYEDFVEGLRPTTLDEEGTEMAAGFRLQPEPGAFRKFAELAEALGAEEGAQSFPLAGRRFFKMSLGEVANPEDDYLFEEAIEGGFLHMGDESGIDWSEPRFDSKSAMIAGYVEKHPDKAPPSQLSGAIEFPFTLRHRVKEGDIIVVSKGNLAFRAIGEVTGDYENVPRDDDYTIRRAVRWLWVNREGLSYSIINNKRFSQRTVYELAQTELKLDALQALLDSHLFPEPAAGPRRARNFVLIIDEINRANISKVFGELITLIEPDKRLGEKNALRTLLPYSKKWFGVPANLHLVGTMNTADRSIALLDTALRRRFVFREIAPDPSLLPDVVDGVPLRRVLEKLNDRIEYLIDREHRIGHAFFLGEGGGNRAEIDATMRDKVIPLLQEYFFEDWSRVAAVLGEPKGKGGGFLDCRRLKDPTGQDGEERESWSVRAVFAPDAYDRLIGSAAASPEVQPGGEIAE